MKEADLIGGWFKKAADDLLIADHAVKLTSIRKKPPLLFVQQSNRLS